MALLLNEEQTMLKNSAKEFCHTKSPVAALRKIRDEKNLLGYDTAVWNKMVEMGWTGLIIPEAYGGLDFGYTGLGQILEETGRTLTASPLFSTVLLGTTPLLLAGNDAQKTAILPRIVSGEIKITLAIDENNRHDPFEIATTATPNDDQYTINGKKKMVLDAHVVDYFVVAVRTSGEATDRKGISLFLVDAKDENIQIEKVLNVDSRNAATVIFNNVSVPVDTVLGKIDEGGTTLEKVLDIARINLSAEMLGGIQEAFQRTVAYLKQRTQFGVAIGTFQGLQHRAAKLYGEIELCKTLVLKSLQAIDADSEDLPILASMCKAKVSSTFQTVANEGIQMFGGIGMTDDEEIGFFLKRASVTRMLFGDSNYHLDRYAQLQGY